MANVVQDFLVVKSKQMKVAIQVIHFKTSGILFQIVYRCLQKIIRPGLVEMSKHVFLSLRQGPQNMPHVWLFCLLKKKYIIVLKQKRQASIFLLKIKNSPIGNQKKKEIAKSKRKLFPLYFK